MTSEHYSVLKSEVLDLFAGRQVKIFVDGTLGAGGHAAAVLSSHPEIEKFVGIDQDRQALEIAKKKLVSSKKNIVFLHGNFLELISELEGDIDGILLDLGVSSMQLDQAERGFSFAKEGPLDMRMNRDKPFTAEEIINNWSASELGRIFRDYGEEKQWRAAANAIVEARKIERIITTTQLSEVLKNAVRKKKGKSIHPHTLIFQALRICVNSELEVVQEVLPICVDKLKPGGCLAVITFHSLEDRIVKKVFRQMASDKHETSGLGGVFLDKEPLVKDLTRRPIIPSEDEIGENPRSRSAKLRAVEKK
ncbi:MAG: 16S rRNA (cytosine(1402)-N(4))-methyltransferase RsmH [Chlamydiota bacterium]